MKSLSFVLIFALLSATAHAGLPPATAQGQSDASPLVTFGLQARASQMTRTSATTALIEAGNRNVLANPSFEATNYSSGWTVTTASASSESTTVVDGKRSMHLAFTASTGDVAQSLTPTTQTDAQNWEASCRVNTTQTTIQVCALTGGTENNCVSVPSTGKWGNVSANFIGPASGSVGVRVKTTGAITGDVYVDDCYVGPARNLSQASGMVSTPWVAYTPTVGGGGSLTTTTLNAQWRRQGDSIQIALYAQVNAAGSGTADVTFSLPSGLSIDTTKLPSTTSTVTLGSGTWFRSASGSINYLSAEYESATTFGFVDTANTLGARWLRGSDLATSDGLSGIITLPIVGWNANLSGTAFTPDLTSASWSGYHSPGCNWTTTSTSFADPADSASCTLNQRKNRNFGTVASTGSTQPNIQFTPPRAGRYLVIANVSLANSSAPTQAALAQLTDQNNVEIGQTQSYVSSASAAASYTISGVLDIPSVATTTVKVRISSTSTGATTHLGAGSSNAIEWSIFQLDASMPTPAIMGQISSNTSGQERVERVSVNTVCSSTPCTISKQSGSWLSSISWTATGNYTLNINPGIFSDVPTCVGNTNEGTGRYLIIDNTSATATSVKLLTYLPTTNVAGNEAFNIICMGPR